MPSIPPPPVPTQLIVFADDWGRHPSSSQHLVRELLPQYKVLWVNTVGTRRPSLSRRDIKRAIGKLWSYIDTNGSVEVDDKHFPNNLTVIDPLMYPGFRKGWQRRFNASRMAKAIRENLIDGYRHVVVTTLPVTADLIGLLPVDRWLYYCVDNYAQWPGTDSYTMEFMEWEMVPKVDAVVCVSEVLQERAIGMGANDPSLLTHGVETTMWRTPATDSAMNPRWPDDRQLIALFWGLVDERMDQSWCEALGDDGTCKVVFAGPKQSELMFLLDVDAFHIGPIPHADLPAHAASAQVLIMPYIDAPVTRAMQPLKLLEYLATMKPVVVRDLPSTRAWADCCDVVGDAESFAKMVALRAKTGTPPEQLEARERRLAGESWTAKAAQLAQVINAGVKKRA